MPAVREIKAEERMKTVRRSTNRKKQASIACDYLIFLFYSCIRVTLGISKSCVIKTLRKFENRGSTEANKRSGRPS